MPDESEFDLETVIKGFSKGIYEINCPKNTLLVSNDIKTKIKSIIIEVTHKTKKLGTTRLNADDKIKMIMEDVDKKKNIILTKNGDVEDKS